MTTMTMPDLDLNGLGAAVTAALAKPASAPAAETYERPKFEMERLEAHPSLMEALTKVVGEHLRGKGKAHDEKRERLVEALALELAELPIYGIEMDYARIPIGEGINLENASVDVDGYGAATTITCDGGTPIWEPR